MIYRYLITGSLTFKLESSHSGRARAPLEDSGQFMSTVDRFLSFVFFTSLPCFSCRGAGIYGTSPVPVDPAHLKWLASQNLEIPVGFSSDVCCRKMPAPCTCMMSCYFFGGVPIGLPVSVLEKHLLCTGSLWLFSQLGP